MTTCFLPAGAGNLSCRVLTSLCARHTLTTSRLVTDFLAATFFKSRSLIGKTGSSDEEEIEATTPPYAGVIIMSSTQKNFAVNAAMPHRRARQINVSPRRCGADQIRISSQELLSSDTAAIYRQDWAGPHLVRCPNRAWRRHASPATPKGSAAMPRTCHHHRRPGSGRHVYAHQHRDSEQSSHSFTFYFWPLTASVSCTQAKSVCTE